MAWRSSGRDQKEMNDNMRRNGVIRSDVVAKAFDTVHTHLFVPAVAGQPFPEVCQDRPIRVGNVHISAPHMYATVLEALELQPGQSMLTIGSGSGYFCTLCSTILGPTGVCHGVEILPDVVAHANAAVAAFLEEHQRARQGLPPVSACVFVAGDGFNLCDKLNMKYDRIYVAAGADEEDVSFFRQFLTVGGVLVGPFGDCLLKVARRTGEDFSTHVVTRVAFAPLVRPMHDATMPKLVLPSPQWSPSLAARFPEHFNQAAACLTILQRRPLSTGGVLSVVPPAIIYHILSFCARDWFVPEVPLVDRLLQQLREEIKARTKAEDRIVLMERELEARQDAENRIAELQRERDEAMILCMVLRAELRRRGPRVPRPPDDDDEELEGDDDDDPVVVTLPTG